MVYFASATLRFDGACQPNPGEGGGGYVVINNKNGRTIVEGRHYVGDDCTNNVAEYFGLIAGLKKIKSSPHTIGHLSIEGDSELVINHLRGTYQVRHRRLRPLYLKARGFINNNFDSHSFTHIAREYNKTADELAREAISNQQHWSRDCYN